MKPLVVHGRVSMSDANRISLDNYGYIELETADRPELALKGALIINGQRYAVIGRSRADVVPGERVALRLAIDRRNRRQRRAAA